jgi:hypothetical protein
MQSLTAGSLKEFARLEVESEIAGGEREYPAIGYAQFDDLRVLKHKTQSRLGAQI